MKVKISKILKFLGRRTLIWLTIGASAGFLTSALELAISYQIQILLKALGLLNQDIVLPGGIKPPEFSIVTFSLILIGIAVLKGLANFLITQSAVISNE